MAEIERRPVLEVRAAPAKRRLEGLAAPYGQVAHIAGFDEIIVDGAFAETLRDGHDILALSDHDHRHLLGRTKTGSLRLEETRSGLAFALDLPDTSLGRDVLALAERGDLGGMSFGFKVRAAGERWVKMTRELRALDLFEISTVAAWPAYEGTTVQTRAAPACLPASPSPCASWRPFKWASARAWRAGSTQSSAA